MKKIFFWSALFCAIAIGFSSCSDDDDNNSSSDDSANVTMAEAKAAVAKSEAQFNSMVDLSGFLKDVKFITNFNSTYGNYTFENNSTAKAINIPLTNLIGSLAMGNVSVIPWFAEKITTLSGFYKADTIKKQWVAENVPELNPRDVLRLTFNDTDGQECQAYLSWANKGYNDPNLPTGGTGAANPPANSAGVSFKNLSSIYFKVIRGNTKLIDVSLNVNYKETTNIIDGMIRINTVNGYALNAYVKESQTTMEGNVIILKNGTSICDVDTQIKGTNLVSHTLDNSANVTTTSCRTMINLSNSVGLELRISDFNAWIKAISAYNNDEPTTTEDINNILSIFNTYVDRYLFLNNNIRPVANLTFQLRSTPTATETVFSYLDTKVNFLTGESCMLNELFTGKERSFFVYYMLAFLDDYRTLAKEQN